MWDRDVTDPLALKLVMALVLQARWTELETWLDRLDEAAARGSGLARAVAAAARGERDGSDRNASHRELRALGYVGLSETLAMRAGGRP